MRKFDCNKVDSIKSKELVEQLVINNIGQLDSFEASLKGTTFESEFSTLLRYIEHFSNEHSVGKKLKYLRNPTFNVVEYEFIGKHIRIYAIQQPGRKIIIYGGVKKKADSSDNIETFRNIKKDYLTSIKNQKHDQR